jgi:hypothetical protein
MQCFNNKVVHKEPKNCLLQFASSDRIVLDASSQLNKSLPGYLNTNEPYRPTNVK